MPLLNPGIGPTGVTQNRGYSCGAACAVHVLTLLGIHVDDPAGAGQQTAMRQTAAFKYLPRLGSTPAAIGSYIERVCAEQIPPRAVTVRRTREAELDDAQLDANRQERKRKPWLMKLRGQLKGSYGEFHVAANGANQAIIRFVIPTTPRSVTSHFIVQTNFAAGIQIMDPTDGYVATVPADWEDEGYDDGRGQISIPVGLDIVIEG